MKKKKRIKELERQMFVVDELFSRIIVQIKTQKKMNKLLKKMIVKVALNAKLK